jgi:hypothetical protein
LIGAAFNGVVFSGPWLKNKSQDDLIGLGATRWSVGNIGAKMGKKQLPHGVLSDKGGVASGEGKGEILPRQGVASEDVFQSFLVVRIGQDIGWKTRVGIVIANRVRKQVLRCVLVHGVLNYPTINLKFISLRRIFPVVRVPLEGGPVPGDGSRLNS